MFIPCDTFFSLIQLD